MISFLLSILILGLLVIVHEFGHFVIARASGVRILRFSMGFGPRLFTWTRGETEYALSAIPLGGYVKMAGEQQTEQTQQPWEYLSKPIGTRAKIIFAGPFVNYLVAAVTLWAVFLIGYPEMLPVVGKTLDEMPAQAAGLQPGDHVAAVDGRAVETWDEMSAIISESANRSIDLLIQRSGSARHVRLTPKEKRITDRLGRRKTVGKIGIEPKGEFRSLRVGPVAAIGRTVVQLNEWTLQTLIALGSLATGRLSMRDSMTGPIGIVYLTSEAVRNGLVPVLFLTSLFSLSLAIFNLFPLPILDGGHLLFLIIEKFRGRPVSISIQERSAQVSLVLLVALVVTTCVNDLSRYGLLEKLVGWVRR